MTTFLPYIAGPASAAVCMAAIIYGIYRFIDRRLWPSVEKNIDRHLCQIDRLIAAHEADRAVWGKGLTKLGGEMEDVREGLQSIRGRLGA